LMSSQYILPGKPLLKGPGPHSGTLSPGI
jgi:hypothetical protein